MPPARWAFFLWEERRRSGPCRPHPAQTQQESWLNLPQWGSVCSRSSSYHLYENTISCNETEWLILPWCWTRTTLPASLASSSLGTPLIFVCLTAEHFLLSCVWALNFTQFMILSTIPEAVAYKWQKFVNVSAKFIQLRVQGHFFSFGTCLINLSLRGQVDPKLFCCRVIFSLVWESKVGFSTRQFTNSHMWFFTWRRSRTLITGRNFDNNITS